MNEFDFKAENSKSCPIATKDISVNIKNRQKAIDDAGYGPLNPTQANNAFWKKKASRWNVTIGGSKKQLCGNCAAFIRTPRMLDCIDEGLGNEKGNSAWDVINAGELGYCEAFDFKCASARTCDAWIVGGPITEEKGKKQETKSLESHYSKNEQKAIEFVQSLSDDEFIALFPNEYSDEANDVKWLFDVSYNFADSVINSRHAGSFAYDEKSAKLRDPKGGLTAAGRKYFNKKEGANLKPGVKGPADTPEKMRRKGSFLVRFFTNPSGPMKDENGKPTRLALSAAAWGEPVPQNAQAAARLAAKGRRLLERYRNHKNAQKKKDISDGIETKAAPPQTIGSSGNRTIGQVNTSRTGQPIGGSRASASSDQYDPNARDADADGNVQEGTEFMRPAQQRAPREPRKAWMTDRGTADTRERGAIRNNLTNRGFDGEAFKKLIGAEARKLKPGQKTNWSPGRLPNGGKIAADGTYIPPDMVREDDKRVGNYYRDRRGQQQTRLTREGDVVPNKNRDRATPKPGSAPDRSGSADTRERRAMGEQLDAAGFDVEAFKKLIDAEARKLKPGQKTNWNPGRLPNGGRIAADGTYIPPEMVREDDNRARDYYRNRRNSSGTGRSGRTTNEGDVAPNKNRDEATPATPPPSIFNPPKNKPRTGWLSPYFAGDYAHDWDD